jgi:sugar phosphate isomerase/epimerase
MPAMNRREFLVSAGAVVACAGAPLQVYAAAEQARGASAAEILGWRLGCCAYSFNRFTFFETVEKISALGLKYVVGYNWQPLSPEKPGLLFSDNLSTADRRAVKKRLADAGVTIPCCYCNKLADEADLRRLFDFAQEMGIATIDGEPPVAALDMLDRLCEQYRIHVAIHSHAKPAPHWQPEELMKLFDGHSRWIGACCDTGHWARSRLDPIATLRILEKRILTFDLKDVNEKGVCVPFGKGLGRIGDILTELHQQRFQGVIGIEYDNPSDRLEKDVAECVAFFHQTSEKLVLKEN